jgi:hypothetical protein
MSPVAISLITLAFVFLGSVFGIFLRAALPQNHVNSDSRDVVKLGMGLVGTMAALVLGLLIGSAKSAFDTQGTELTQMSSSIVLLDRLLAHYGPEAGESRRLIRAAVVRSLQRSWPEENVASLTPSDQSGDPEALYDKLQELEPKTDSQRLIQAQSLSLVIGLAQVHWLVYEQKASSVSMPLLAVLIFWLTVIFISFGLFAPRNATVLISLFISSLSVSFAIFLILEMYTPYGGLIQISSAPLRATLVHLGQ